MGQEKDAVIMIRLPASDKEVFRTRCNQLGSDISTVMRILVQHVNDFGVSADGVLTIDVTKSLEGLGRAPAAVGGKGARS